MTYFKKIILVLLIILCSPSLFAADVSAASNNESLQQQLQSLQESLQAPASVPVQAPVAKISQTTTTTVSPTNTNTTPLVVSDPPAVLPTPIAPAAPLLAPAAAVSAPASTPALEIGAENDLMPVNDLRTEAFGKMVNTALPLSPSQIRLLRNMYDATQQAAVTYPGVPPRPTASSIAVNLAPGATPPVVRLGAGFVTSLVFVDSTGAPWPIDSYSLGNPTAFNIQWDKKSNILLIQAVTAHRMGNLAVILKGLNTPVMIDINPGQAAMDVRVDLRIPGFGPNAKPSFETLPGTESPALLALLDGIPPQGAKNLKSSACENCVWLLEGKLYLRTQFTVLSPAWISTLSSADGTHVYEMQPTPLILASYNGKTIKMRIEGF